MSSIIKVARFFDGQKIIDSVAIETEQNQIVRIVPLEPMPGGSNHDVEFLSPQFYDWSLRLRGYRRRLSEVPYACLEYFDELLGHYGVRGGLDIGNTWERIAVARDMLNIGREVVWGGPLLTTARPQHETELFVRDSQMVRNAVEQAVLQRAGMIVLGQSFTPDLVACAINEARKRSLLVLAIPGRTLPIQLLNLGIDMLLGIHNLGFEIIDWKPGLSPFDLARSWAEISVRDLIDRLATGFDTNPAGVITEMVAFRKLVFVQEAVHSTSLELLIPILPDMAWLLEMRSSVGYLVGKKKLFEATGLKALNRSEKSVAERGMENLAQFACTIAGLTRILPGSRSASLGVVPGWGLIEELSYLRQLGFATEQLLCSVTSEATQLLGVDNEEAEQPALFVASRVPFDGSATSFLNLRGFKLEDIVAHG